MPKISTAATRARHALIAVAASAAIPPAAAAPEALLVLSNEAFLRGSLESADSTTLRWNHPASGTTLPMPVSSVDRLVYDPAEPDAAIGDVLHLHDGLLTGRLEALDRNSATFNSPALGKRIIDRSLIASARLHSDIHTPVFTNFPPIGKWTNSMDGKPSKPAEWRIEDNRLIFSGNMTEIVQADVKLPESCEIRFDISQNPDRPRDGQLQIDLAFDPANQSGEDFYTVNITSRMIFVQRNSAAANRRSNIFGRVQMADILSGSNVARIRLILDRPSKRVHLFVNGRNAGSWSDSQGTPDSLPEGSWIRFRGQQRFPNELRNFSVRRWNGVLDGNPGKPENFTGERDRIDILHGGGGNDQILHGEITGMETDNDGNRSLLIRTPHVREGSAIPVSVEAIRQVFFADPGAPPEKEENPDGEENQPPSAQTNDPDTRKSMGNSRIHLRDSTIFRANLVGGSSSTLEFTSPITGPININADQLLSIQFFHPAGTSAADPDEEEVPQPADEE